MSHFLEVHICHWSTSIFMNCNFMDFTYWRWIWCWILKANHDSFVPLLLSIFPFPPFMAHFLSSSILTNCRTLVCNGTFFFSWWWYKSASCLPGKAVHLCWFLSFFWTKYLFLIFFYGLYCNSRAYQVHIARLPHGKHILSARLFHVISLKQHSRFRSLTYTVIKSIKFDRYHYSAEFH